VGRSVYCFVWNRKTASTKLHNRTQIYIHIYAFPHAGDWINRQILFGIKHVEKLWTVHLCVAYLNRFLFSFSPLRENSRRKICCHNGCISCALCFTQSKNLSTTIAKILFRSGCYCSWICSGNYEQRASSMHSSVTHKKKLHFFPNTYFLKMTAKHILCDKVHSVQWNHGNSNVVSHEKTMWYVQRETDGKNKLFVFYSCSSDVCRASISITFSSLPLKMDHVGIRSNKVISVVFT
jgi:hypothetical protein